MKLSDLLLFLSCSLVSCTETTLTQYPPPEIDQSESDLEGGRTPMSTPKQMQIIGRACESTPEVCEDGFCIDGPYLMMLGLEPSQLPAPGGLCSKFCAQNSDCGDGGRCFNTQPFSGVPIKACLATCEIQVDCRWREGYGCFDPKTVDENDDGAAVCMPDGFIYEVYCAADDTQCEAPSGGASE